MIFYLESEAIHFAWSWYLMYLNVLIVKVSIGKITSMNSHIHLGVGRYIIGF